MFLHTISPARVTLSLLLSLVAGATASRAGGSPAGPPQMDLMLNRFRWHLYRPQLLIPLASEGFRKYVTEYRAPWAEVVTIDRRAGRRLGAAEALLRFPWGWAEEGRPSTLRLRLHGVVGEQGVVVWLNGRKLGTARLGARWQAVDLPLGAQLRRGENELKLRMSRGGRRGAGRAYGLFHSIELIGAEPSKRGADAAWPALSPVVTATVGGEKRAALRGFARLVIPLEVPPQAALEFHTGGAAASAHFTIAARPLSGGAPRRLFDHRQLPGVWRAHRLSLAGLGGQLIALELTTGGDPAAAWGEPRIVLPRREVKRRPAVRNVILWVGDALRSDRLGLYGRTRVRTPRLEAAARRGGVVFLNNQAATPSSPPSHASIQTGLTPRVHGVTGDKARLSPGVTMISATLADAGIRAAYYGNNPFGMDRLRKAGRWHAFHQPVREGQGSDCTKLVDLMLGYASRQKKAGKRYFISALAYEPHVPYRFHEGVTERYFAGPFEPPFGKRATGQLLVKVAQGKLQMSKRRWDQVKGLYAGEVEYMDRCLGSLLDGLKTLGQQRETAVIFTSDHGEGFWEHGKIGHAFGMYGELTNVPLVLLVPGLTDRLVKVETPSGHVDIVPTVLDLLGVPGHPRLQGISLLPLAQRAGSWTARVVTMEYGRSYALRSRRFKYAVDYGGKEELFDTRKDPAEQTAINRRVPGVLRYFRDLGGFYLAHRVAWREASWGSIDNHRRGFVDYLARRR